jgi:membrane-associated phospholipid phosphatase
MRRASTGFKHRHRVFKSFAAAWIGLLVVFSSALARAEPKPRTDGKRALTWDFPVFRTSEYVATSVAGAAAIGVFVFAKPRSVPRWTGGILFDDALRDAVRLRSPQARDRVRMLSDVTGIASLVLLLGVDSLLIPLWRGSPRVAGQLLLLDAEAFAFNGLLTYSAFYSIGRARPSYDDCQRNPRFDPFCNPHDTASFWSGHTALAFAAAGLSCAHHSYVKLYGGGAPDAIACAGAIALSASTSALRVLGDRHHATDVLAGALVGFGFGYATPTLLHYSQPSGDSRRIGLALAPIEQGLGLSAAGAF